MARILLVEKDEGLRQMFLNYFDTLDEKLYKITIAENFLSAQAALKLLNAQDTSKIPDASDSPDFDLIISGENLFNQQDGQGIELVELIRQNMNPYYHTPVLLTYSCGQGALSASKVYEGIFLMAKPFRLVTFKEKVEEALRWRPAEDHITRSSSQPQP